MLHLAMLFGYGGWEGLREERIADNVLQRVPEECRLRGQRRAVESEALSTTGLREGQ